MRGETARSKIPGSLRKHTRSGTWFWRIGRHHVPEKILVGRPDCLAAMDEEHFWTAMAFVERNPVRAKLCRVAWRYPWSSAAAHCVGKDASGLLDLAAWQERLAGASGSWQEALGSGQDEEAESAVRLFLRRGRPLGGDAWLAKLETRLGRRLRPFR
jgi:putative transposase